MDVFLLNRYDCLASNCYIVCDGDEYMIIDPSVSYYDMIKKYPKLQDVTFKYIILTHAHVDHFLEIESYIRSGTEVLISKLDLPKLSAPDLNCANWLETKILGYFDKTGILTIGGEIKLGNIIFTVLSTPGHTDGSVSLLCDDCIFTGDTLFSDGFGRYDLPSGDFESLQKSLNLLMTLDDNLMVYSGHGPCSLLKDIKKAFLS